MNSWIVRILCFIGIHTPEVFDRQENYYREKCSDCLKIDETKYKYEED